MAKEYNLEEGLKESINRIESITDNPILVAVYGWPHSGKSYFIKRLWEYFEDKGIDSFGHDNAPTLTHFNTIKDRLFHFPAYKWIEIFHCAWDKRNDLFEHEDPNSLAQNILGRNVNLDIGIYNPLHRLPLYGDYDILINNPDSLIKNIKILDE